MKGIFLFLLVALSTLSVSAADETEPLSDVEVWNQGVDYYRAGDVTNALKTLRPLMLSRTHGDRAAEVVAKLELERGDREEAATAAQIALRKHPNDERVRRNFVRASDGLKGVRATKHINEVLKAAQGKDPGAMMLASVKDARRIFTESGVYRTNSVERVVVIGDKLAKDVGRLADSWIPLREAIVQAVTNEEQAATILAQIEGAQEKTKSAMIAFEDIDENSYSLMSEVERDFTRFLKMTIMPPAAMQEDYIAQSNAWMDVEGFNSRAWQPEALDYTRAFRTKFPAWARAYEQQAQADTNKPPFTVEDQAKISGLATELEKLQLECCEKCLPPSQERALEIIQEIIALLPKDANGGQGGGQGQQSNDKQNQQQQQDQQQDQSQNDQGQQSNEQQGDQEMEEEKEQEEQAAEAKEDEQQKTDEEIEAMLKKAQERNDEHEADKKLRMRNAPLPPNEKDW